MQILLADWVLPVSSPPIRDGAVVIEHDLIIGVGTREEITAAFDAERMEEFGEAAIIPGLINCHSHLELTAMRGLLDDVEHDFLAWLLKLTKVRAEFLTDEDIEYFAMLGAVEGARAGVTCFADVGRSGLAAMKALNELKLRGIVYQETEFCPDDTLAGESFEKLKEKFKALSWEETALTRAGISPHSPYTVCPELFRKIVEYAGSDDVKTSIHCAESRMENDFMLRGEGLMAGFWQKSGAVWNTPEMSSVRYLSSLGVLDIKPLLAHCINVDEADLELIANSGATIAHCPKSNAKFGHGIAPLEKMLAKNIGVGLGSDSVASNNSCDIIEEGRIASLFARTLPDSQRMIPAAEALEMMTLGGARALGLENKIGSLEPGKQADLAVISFDNAAVMPVFDPAAAIVFSSNARDVELTMVAGKEIYRDGEMTYADVYDRSRIVPELVKKLSSI